ncbi:MAG: hypothetical protein JO309_03840 [Pseudonocardiales bacterium]|nr:hypothetical protein [Pseudonocardiales bacterium]MBV9728541.1 hypothetical protein [Pseudonocardiales bacterium]
MMLFEQNKHAHKQSQQLFFELRWRYGLFASKLVGELLKMLQKKPIPSFPNVAHGSWWDSTLCTLKSVMPTPGQQGLLTHVGHDYRG